MTKNNWFLPWNEALTTSTGEFPASTAPWSCYCCLHLLFSFYFQVLHSDSTAGNEYLQPFEIKYGCWNDSEKCGKKYKCQNMVHILRGRDHKNFGENNRKRFDYFWMSTTYKNIPHVKKKFKYDVGPWNLPTSLPRPLVDASGLSRTRWWVEIKKKKFERPPDDRNLHLTRFFSFIFSSFTSNGCLTLKRHSSSTNCNFLQFLARWTIKSNEMSDHRAELWGHSHLWQDCSNTGNG